MFCIGLISLFKAIIYKRLILLEVYVSLVESVTDPIFLLILFSEWPLMNAVVVGLC